MANSRTDWLTQPSGILIIDKPAGPTSQQVVARIRRVAGTRKVGHAGTLDPMATGVLVVGVNRATRLLGHLALTDKDYQATIRLGIATTTDDADGEILAVGGASNVPTERIQARIARMRGDLVQVPSSVSALKIDGVRAHARVRAGEEVTLAGRHVHVSQFDLLARRDLTSPSGAELVDLDVAVRCSSGTYIRALARDLGTSLGTGGHLTALRRSRVGPYALDRAQTLDEAEQNLALLAMRAVAVECFAHISLDETQEVDVRHGRRLVGVSLPADLTALLGGTGDLLALYRRSGPDAVAEAVFV